MISVRHSSEPMRTLVMMLVGVCKEQIPAKNLSRAAIAKLLEARRRSWPQQRAKAHARTGFMQREIRQRMTQHLQEKGQHHIGHKVSPMGANDEYISRACRGGCLSQLSCNAPDQRGRVRIVLVAWLGVLVLTIIPSTSSSGKAGATNNIFF